MKKLHFYWIVAILGSLLACTQTNPPTNTADKMKEIKSGGVNINYNMSGKGPTTLVFIHGSYIDQTYWDAQVAHFSPNYRVVTLDLPGHGQSGRNRNDWSVKQFGQDVIALLDQLDLHNVILIGHSMGGDVALEVAVARPERIIGFVAVDFFKNAATPMPNHEEEVKKIVAQLRADFVNTNEQYARTYLLTPQTDSATTQRVVADYRNAYQPMGMTVMEDVFNYYQREQELLPKLQRKLYLINIDYFPTNEAPLKKFTGASYKLVTMHGTSHYPMIENPAEFNRLLEGVIGEVVRKNM